MTSFVYKMSATFGLSTDNSLKELDLVKRMTYLDPGTGGKTKFSTGFDDNTGVLTLTLQSETEEAQQIALKVYGPDLAELANMAPRLSLNCTENAPPALKAMLAPMTAVYSADF